jgi:hypothetical protein
MGASQSSTVNQTTEVINKSITNMVSKSTNSASAKNVNANMFRFTNGKGGETIDCDIKVGQSIKAKQGIKVMAKFKSLADLQTQLKTALKNSVDQSSELEQKSLATTIGVQNSKQSINQKISNIVESSITNETLNTVNGFLDNLNKYHFINYGKIKCSPGQKIQADQSIVSEQLVELLADSIIENVTSTKTDSDASAESEQSSKLKQSGLLSDLGNLLSGPFMIIGLVVIVLAILAYVFRGSISKIAERKAGVPSSPVNFGNKKMKRVLKTLSKF